MLSVVLVLSQSLFQSNMNNNKHVGKLVKYRRGLVTDHQLKIKEAILLDYVDDKVIFHSNNHTLDARGYYTTHDNIRTATGCIMSRNTVVGIINKLTTGENSILIKTIVANGDTDGKKMYLRFRDPNFQKLVKGEINTVDLYNGNFTVYVNLKTAYEHGLPVAILTSVIPVMVKANRLHQEKHALTPNDGWLEFTRRELVEETCLSYDQVRDGLEALVALNWIEINNKHGGNFSETGNLSLLRIVKNL